MAHIKSTLRHSSLCPDVQRLYWCACCFGFFGFLRASEFTTAPHSSFQSSQHTLIFHNITTTADRSLVLHLPHSKFASNERIVLLPTDRSICPFRAYMSYLPFRRELDDQYPPFFMFPDKSFLSYTIFNSAIKSFLQDLSDSHLCSTHSFRIGAATSASATVPRTPSSRRQVDERAKSTGLEVLLVTDVMAMAGKPEGRGSRNARNPQRQSAATPIHFQRRRGAYYSGGKKRVQKT
ncbi:hypothetical protein RvY_17167 [Ramazzottius varieornatus]|uniref:Tyr recombinase domain-containing protein n=1 Tax=Ramazzottius varieornatus TaxID=947166 RepID=A0A1D1W1N0_RAMVA|nr:hypothetical protein RvY_17167 [Ramazzottius varieornatus]